MKRRQARGLTLIEVMVAIAIFAVLGILSWRAVSSMSDTRERMDAAFSRWQSLARVMQLLENDLLQVAPRTGPNAGATLPALILMRGSARDELRITRHDGTNGGLQRRAYWLENNRLILARYPALDDSAQPSQDVLLEGVKAVRWRFISASAGEQDNWPIGLQPGVAIPDGVRVEMDLADVGTITRTFALR
ncbi:type II secretion system minor pseudopilin GspJ [Niveibacterium sp. SC-1]|uniref:type II secretion system minor pseudopilin GspJ n=1 Tax=Niveibacterium sp. SC-1 TaxID=3135646 RepID=UPI00311EB1D1